MELLIDACERALALRGVVMVQRRDDERCWAACCAAVDGSIELRVGEPSRGWRRWRPSAEEDWLREHGFIHDPDAWSLPTTLAPRACAALLHDALRHGLGMPANAELVERLVHPGLIGDTPPPLPDAPHVAHLRYALIALSELGHGKFDVQGGRPAQTWAWVFTADGALEISPEPIGDDPVDYRRDWTASYDLDAEANKLAALLYGELGRDPGAPLFIAFMPN